MSARFLGEFMQFALSKTQAERALAYDRDLNIVGNVRFSSAEVLDQNFKGPEYAQKAIQKGEIVITNNAIINPEQAPSTNTNFSNLRIIVVIPAANLGAIYLDRPIRRGVIPRDVVAKLEKTASACAASGTLDFEAHYNGN